MADLSGLLHLPHAILPKKFNARVFQCEAEGLHGAVIGCPASGFKILDCADADMGNFCKIILRPAQQGTRGFALFGRNYHFLLDETINVVLLVLY